jgi:hypothetical protein
LGGVAALAACIVVLLGAGVVGALTIEEEADVATDLAVPSTVVQEAPVEPPLDLSTVVVGGPPGFDQIPDDRLLVGGAADLDRLAAERSDQTRSKAVFVETGLVNGFVRAWQKPSTAELVTVRLYQFKTADGAKSYANRIVSAMSNPPATTFPVPATDNTTGIDTQTAQGANKVVYVVSRKNRVVSAIAATVAPPPEAGFLPPLARSQQTLLP